ncbi:MAG: hypothetical protein NTW49_01430, partial [Bacteroidia bacterium]|nr:hypothetical protein [Bacteroidia bacterium]
MRTILSFCFTAMIIVVVNTASYSQWQQVPSSMDNLSVWVLTSYGTDIMAATNNGLYTSSDQGASWNLFGLAGYELYDVTVNGADVFAASWGNGLFKSSDNGATWGNINNGINDNFLYNVYVLGSDIYVCAGSGLYFSNDYGVSFSLVNIGVPTGVTSLAFNYPVIAASTAAGIYISQDNGNSWSASGFTSFAWFVGFDGSQIYAAANNTGLFVSSDYFTTWQQLNSGVVTNYNYLAFHGSVIYAGTNNGIYVSFNGIDWFSINDGLGNNFSSWTFYFTDNNVFTGGFLTSLWERPLTDFNYSVETLPSSSIGYNQANLDGRVHPGGSNITCGFVYGLTTNYGDTIVQGSANGYDAVWFTTHVTGLLADMTYHYRFFGIQGNDTTYGNDETILIPANIPSPVLTVVGDGYACEDDSILLQATNLQGYQLQWKFNDVPIPGITDSFYYAHLGGNYSVQLLTNFGPVSSSTVTLNIIDPLNGMGFVNNNGLIAYYPFNGNANDASGNGYNGYLNGPVLANDKDNNPNQAYSFNGYGDYINFGTLNGSSYSGELTVSVWANPISYNQYGGIVTKGSGNYEDFSIITMSDQKFHFRANWPDNWYDLPSVSYDTVDHWYLITCTFDHGNVSMYINGVLENTGTWPTSTLNDNSDSWLAAGVNQPGSWEYFYGSIDEIRLYNRVLSPAEINNLYTGQIDIISSNNPVCLGSSLQLTAPAFSGATYAWTGPANFSSSDQNPVIVNADYSNAGTYSLMISNNGCSSGTMTTNVQIDEPPVIDLGPDQTICFNSGTVLSAYPLTDSSKTYHYLWSDGSTMYHLTVSSAGTYSVTVTDSYGCSTIGEVVISTLPEISIQLPDTLIVPCGQTSATLDEESGYAYYYWNTGETTNMINVYGSGYYTVTVTNQDGCSQSKSVLVSRIPASPSSPLYACYNTPFTINVPDTTIVVVSDVTIKSNIPYNYTDNWMQPGYDDSFWNNAVISNCGGEGSSTITGATGIWDPSFNTDTYYRKTFNLQSMPSSANITINAYNFFLLYINGNYVTQIYSWGGNSSFDILPYIQTGNNL